MEQITAPRECCEGSGKYAVWKLNSNLNHLWVVIKIADYPGLAFIWRFDDFWKAWALCCKLNAYFPKGARPGDVAKDVK
jgi:hypothetical protein